MLCSHCPRHTHRDFLREKEKGSRQGRNSWIAGTALPGWSHPGQPWQQQPEGKKAFTASPGAVEGTHCSCPNQASLPNKAETVKLQELQPELCGQGNPNQPRAPQCWGG